ncbi:MAG: nucleotide sugar dehydrogenase, partial [Planctomycetota bacterium]
MPSPADTLRSKFADNSARIGVIGLGYVGLPLMAAFHRAGFPVIGFDVDPKKIEQLHAGRNYLAHLGETLASDMLGDRFDATVDMDRLGEADVVISCVPTPLGNHLEPDLSYVEQTAIDIAKTLRSGQLITLESTTYPRTTRDVMLPHFEKGGLKVGEDFFLAYSPEREDPGRKDHSTATIPKLVGGIDPLSGELATEIYRHAIAEVIPVDTAEIAEAAKLLENIYRAVNIAMVNEMKVLMTAMDIDVWKVIDAAKTKPFGFQAFY